MDTATIVMATAVIEAGTLRGSARRLGRPAATVAAAVDRLEAALALVLVHRAGSGLTFTLEATRLAPTLGRLRDLAVDLATMPAGGVEAAGDGDTALSAAARRGVSFEALRRFVDVGRAGSVRRAARRLGVGQPQLARQMGHLEAVLGSRLLDRGADGCRATAEGRRVEALAVEIVALWTSLTASAGHQFHREIHTMRLGAIVPLGHESRIARVVAAVVADWVASRRHDHLSVVSSTADELLERLRAGRLDLALVDIDALPFGLEGERLALTRLALVGHPGFAGGRSPAAILREDRVAVPSLRSGLRQRIGSIVGNPDGPGRTPANFVEVDSIPVIVNLVARHRFVSVLPLASTTAVPAAFDRIALDPAFDLPLWLVWQPSEAARLVGRAMLGVMTAALAA